MDELSGFISPRNSSYYAYSKQPAPHLILSLCLPRPISATMCIFPFYSATRGELACVPALADGLSVIVKKSKSPSSSGCYSKSVRYSEQNLVKLYSTFHGPVLALLTHCIPINIRQQPSLYL